jgi:peroxiredoxin
MALSVDEREEQQLMIDRVAEEYEAQIDFTLLADPDNAVIDRYGVFNPDESRGRAVPHPTTLVIDKQGVVRWKLIEIDFRIRPTNEAILAALAELD